MRIFTLFILLFTFLFSNAQSLPIDFETTIGTADFVDFSGGVATVIANPQSSGTNTSGMVAQIVRDGGEIWAGSKILLSDNLDFSSDNEISMKVFTTAPAGTTVKFKLESAAGAVERDVQTTLSGEWELMTWDFTGTPADFNEVVFMFDFGNVGDGSATSTFLFDDVQQESGSGGATQIDLPVDFEGSTVNYTTTDFGGNASSLVTDPTDPNNTVVQVIKTAVAETWAGTTIGTPAGFATNIPLTLDDSKMLVSVWSTGPGIPIRLKVENANDPTQTCETETNTTVAGWEVLEFDFNNEAPGTQSLEVGLQMGWIYSMASIFFNFGTDGATAGEQTYFFDNVQFGSISNTTLPEIADLKLFPNPTQAEWTVSAVENITMIELFDLKGKLIRTIAPNNIISTINASNLMNGIYVAKISTKSAASVVRLVKGK